MFHQLFGTLVGGSHCSGHAGEYVLATGMGLTSVIRGLFREELNMMFENLGHESLLSHWSF